MAKYRKRPVVIEADQWNGTMVEARHLGLDIADDGSVGIQTLEGFMEAKSGDWIITGVKGERYPCKPDIFAETYEAA